MASTSQYFYLSQTFRLGVKVHQIPNHVVTWCAEKLQNDTYNMKLGQILSKILAKTHVRNMQD